MLIAQCVPQQLLGMNATALSSLLIFWHMNEVYACCNILLFEPWQMTGHMICVDEMFPAFDHTDGLVCLYVTSCLRAFLGLQVLERQGWAYAGDSPVLEALSSSRAFQDVVCC